MVKVRLSAWHMLPIAIGLHGLLLAYPMPKTADKGADIDLDLDKPIRIMTLPAKQKNLQQVVKPKKPALTVQKPTTPRLTQHPSVPPIAPQPKPSPVVQASTSPQPSSTPTPHSTNAASPSPKPTVSPSPTVPDGIQVDGATGCQGVEGCYALTESNGRAVLERITQKLKAQNYELESLDLEDDTGMSAYKLSKQQQPQGYLYVVWSDKGTTYLKTQSQLNRSELEARIQQALG